MLDCTGCKFIEELSHPNAYCYMFKHKPLTCNRNVSSLSHLNKNKNQQKDYNAEASLALSAMFK